MNCTIRLIHGTGCKCIRKYSYLNMIIVVDNGDDGDDDGVDVGCGRGCVCV
jgi:hypothetical protein